MGAACLLSAVVSIIAMFTMMGGKNAKLIAHRLSTVVNADQIIVLDEGHIAQQGTHKELVKAGGLYARMWKEYNRAAEWRITA